MKVTAAEQDAQVKKRLISNFLSLSSVQTLNYILPLITVPYLVRILGPEKFGLIAFAQAFVGYFSIITDYGFNLSATRSISIYRDDKEKVSLIFGTVITIKLVLVILSFLTLVFLVCSIDKLRADYLVYLFAFGFILGNAIFPAWLFQGLERMRQMAILNALGKVLYTVIIFLFIRRRADYLYVPLINSMGIFTVGLISLWMVRRYDIKIKIPTINEIKCELKEGWYIFISTFVTSIYTASNTFILGIFASNTIVGYYSAGERVVRAALALIGPFTQTTYPHISKLVSESKTAALNFIRKTFRIIGILTFVSSLILFALAPQISRIVLGRQFDESITVIRILSFLPFIIGLGNVFGMQVMLNFGLQEILSKIFIAASFINIILAFILVVPLQHIGISIAVLMAEIFATSSMIIILQRKGLRVWQFGALAGPIQ